MDIYQLKITLHGMRPPIWRRILVSSNTTLARLHTIIQTSMGWEGYHLFSFECYGEMHDNEAGGLSTKLSAFGFGAQSQFKYIYDFGDDWTHKILVEKILPKNSVPHIPVCIAGKRACPPEDSGGVWGYQSKLDIIANKNDPEYEDVAEWMGECFHPEFFNIDSINKKLGV